MNERQPLMGVRTVGKFTTVRALEAGDHFALKRDINHWQAGRSRGTPRVFRRTDDPYWSEVVTTDVFTRKRVWKRRATSPSDPCIKLEVGEPTRAAPPARTEIADCPWCDGTGEDPKAPANDAGVQVCTHCHGSGIHTDNKEAPHGARARPTPEA